MVERSSLMIPAGIKKVSWEKYLHFLFLTSNFLAHVPRLPSLPPSSRFLVLIVTGKHFCIVARENGNGSLFSFRSDLLLRRIAGTKTSPSAQKKPTFMQHLSAARIRSKPTVFALKIRKNGCLYVWSGNFLALVPKFQWKK